MRRHAMIHSQRRPQPLPRPPRPDTARIGTVANFGAELCPRDQIVPLASFLKDGSHQQSLAANSVSVRVDVARGMPPKLVTAGRGKGPCCGGPPCLISLLSNLTSNPLSVRRRRSIRRRRLLSGSAPIRHHGKGYRQCLRAPVLQGCRRWHIGPHATPALGPAGRVPVSQQRAVGFPLGARPQGVQFRPHGWISSPKPYNDCGIHRCLSPRTRSTRTPTTCADVFPPRCKLRSLA